jgi:hypothetical protein
MLSITLHPSASFSQDCKYLCAMKGILVSPQELPVGMMIDDASLPTEVTTA